VSVNPLAADLDHILAHSQGIWPSLRNARLFITGGTGFFGRWLLESLTWADDQLQLGLQATVLSRDPAAFAAKAPHLAAHKALHWHFGDVRNFRFPTPPSGGFTHIIHAATESAGDLARRDPQGLLESIVFGTSRTLDFAHESGARDILYISSGAVYGRQPPDLQRVSEDFTGTPHTLDAFGAYGEGKRTAEHACHLYARDFGLRIRIARGFAFVGPHLPLNAHFAVGNFIRDALAGGPIRVQGDGTPYRSYLYAADLALWLWTILVNGKSGETYNVGSDQDITIADLARLVAATVAPCAAVQILTPTVPGTPASRYVPCIDRARHDLGLAPLIPLPEAIARTAQWHRASISR